MRTLVWRRLEKALEERLSLWAPGAFRRGDRIAVTTYGSVDPRSAGSFHALLVPAGREALGNKAAEVIAHMDFPRRYAFVDPPHRLDRKDEWRLEMIAGPVIHRLAGHTVQVRVGTLICSIPRSITADSPLERKRKAIWHNPLRNKLVADAATELGSGDRNALERLGLVSIASAVTDPLRVVVLVESTEHAREFSRFLAESPIVDAVPRRRPASTPQRDGSPELVNSTPVLVTMTVAAQRRVFTDVLVRASGGNGRFDVQGFPDASADAEFHENLVIDIEDQGDPMAQNDSRQRLQDYNNRAWKLELGRTREMSDEQQDLT
jgi:hypothetical protein